MPRFQLPKLPSFSRFIDRHIGASIAAALALGVLMALGFAWYVSATCDAATTCSWWQETLCKESPGKMWTAIPDYLTRPEHWKP